MKIFPRISALFLSLAIALPNPAFALRTENFKEAGVEEELQLALADPADPVHATARVITERLAGTLGISRVPPASLAAAGAEEGLIQKVAASVARGQGLNPAAEAVLVRYLSREQEFDSAVSSLRKVNPKRITNLREASGILHQADAALKSQHQFFEKSREDEIPVSPAPPSPTVAEEFQKPIDIRLPPAKPWQGRSIWATTVILLLLGVTAYWFLFEANQPPVPVPIQPVPLPAPKHAPLRLDQAEVREKSLWVMVPEGHDGQLVVPLLKTDFWYPQWRFAVQIPKGVTELDFPIPVDGPNKPGPKGSDGVGYFILERLKPEPGQEKKMPEEFFIPELLIHQPGVLFVATFDPKTGQRQFAWDRKKDPRAGAEEDGGMRQARMFLDLYKTKAKQIGEISWWSWFLNPFLWSGAAYNQRVAALRAQAEQIPKLEGVEKVLAAGDTAGTIQAIEQVLRDLRALVDSKHVQPEEVAPLAENLNHALGFLPGSAQYQRGQVSGVLMQLKAYEQERGRLSSQVSLPDVGSIRTVLSAENPDLKEAARLISETRSHLQDFPDLDRILEYAHRLLSAGAGRDTSLSVDESEQIGEPAIAFLGRDLTLEEVLTELSKFKPDLVEIGKEMAPGKDSIFGGNIMMPDKRGQWGEKDKTHFLNKLRRMSPQNSWEQQPSFDLVIQDQSWNRYGTPLHGLNAPYRIALVGLFLPGSARPAAGVEEPSFVSINPEYARRHAAELAEVDAGDPLWAHGPNWGPDRFPMESRPSTGTVLKNLWDLSFAVVEDDAGAPVAYLYGTDGQPDYPVSQQNPGLFIFRLRVRWDHAGQKLAPWLILNAARAAKKRGIGPNIALETPQGNNHARHVFETIGFENKGTRLDARTGVRFVQYAAPLDRVILGAEGLIQQKYPMALHNTLNQRIRAWQAQALQTGLRYHQKRWAAKSSRLPDDQVSRWFNDPETETPAWLKTSLETGALILHEAFTDKLNENDPPIILEVLQRYNDLIARELGADLDYPMLEWALGIPKDSGKEYVIWLRGVSTSFETILQRMRILSSAASGYGRLVGALTMITMQGFEPKPLLEFVSDLTHTDFKEREPAFIVLHLFIQLAGFSSDLGMKESQSLAATLAGVTVETIAELVDPLKKLLSYRSEESSGEGLFIPELEVRARAQELLSDIALAGGASDGLVATLPLIERNLEQVSTGEILASEHSDAYHSAVDDFVRSALNALILYAEVSSPPAVRMEVGLRVLRFLERYGRESSIRNGVVAAYRSVARKAVYPRSVYLSAYQRWGPEVPDQDSAALTLQLMLPETNTVGNLAIHKEVFAALGDARSETAVSENVPARDAGDLLFRMAAEDGPDKALALLDLLKKRRVEVIVNGTLHLDWYRPFPDQSNVNIKLAAGAEEGLRREFGNTGLQLPVLGAGTIWLGRPWTPDKVASYTYPDEPEIDAYLDAIFARLGPEGRVMIDTAASYGFSEERLGRYFQAYPERLSQAFIATKWGERQQHDPSKEIKDQWTFWPEYTLANLKESVAQSLARLGRIDLLYLHMVTGATADVLRDHSIIDEMVRLKREEVGGIKYLGASISDPKVLEEAVHSKLLGPFDVIQTSGDVFLKRPDLIKKLRADQKAIVLNSVIRRGDRSISERESYFRLLNSPDVSMILTGSRNHYRDNIGYAEEWARSKASPAAGVEQDPPLSYAQVMGQAGEQRMAPWPHTKGVYVPVREIPEQGIWLDWDLIKAWPMGIRLAFPPEPKSSRPDNWEFLLLIPSPAEPSGMQARIYHDDLDPDRERALVRKVDLYPSDKGYSARYVQLLRELSVVPGVGVSFRPQYRNKGFNPLNTGHHGAFIEYLPSDLASITDRLFERIQAPAEPLLREVFFALARLDYSADPDLRARVWQVFADELQKGHSGRRQIEMIELLDRLSTEQSLIEPALKLLRDLARQEGETGAVAVSLQREIRLLEQRLTAVQQGRVFSPRPVHLSLRTPLNDLRKYFGRDDWAEDRHLRAHAARILARRPEAEAVSILLERLRPDSQDLEPSVRSEIVRSVSTRRYRNFPEQQKEALRLFFTLLYPPKDQQELAEPDRGVRIQLLRALWNMSGKMEASDVKRAYGLLDIMAEEDRGPEGLEIQRTSQAVRRMIRVYWNTGDLDALKTQWDSLIADVREEASSLPGKEAAHWGKEVVDWVTALRGSVQSDDFRNLPMHMDRLIERIDRSQQSARPKKETRLWLNRVRWELRAWRGIFAWLERAAAGAEQKAKTREMLAKELWTSGGFGFINRKDTAGGYPLEADPKFVAQFAGRVMERGLIPKLGIPEGDAVSLEALRIFREEHPAATVGVAIEHPSQVADVIDAAQNRNLIISAPGGIIQKVFQEIGKAELSLDRVLVIAKIKDSSEVWPVHGAAGWWYGLEVEPAIGPTVEIRETRILLDEVLTNDYLSLVIGVGSAGGINNAEDAASLLSRGYVGFSVGPATLDAKLRWFTAAQEMLRQWKAQTVIEQRQGNLGYAIYILESAWNRGQVDTVILQSANGETPLKLDDLLREFSSLDGALIEIGRQLQQMRVEETQEFLIELYGDKRLRISLLPADPAAGGAEQIPLDPGVADKNAIFITPGMAGPQLFESLRIFKPAPGEQLSLVVFAEHAFHEAEIEKWLAQAGLEAREIVNVQQAIQGHPGWNLFDVVADKQAEYYLGTGGEVRTLWSFSDLRGLGRLLGITPIHVQLWENSLQLQFSTEA